MAHDCLGYYTATRSVEGLKQQQSHNFNIAIPQKLMILMNYYQNLTWAVDI